jgi:hypothetical protein
MAMQTFIRSLLEFFRQALLSVPGLEIVLFNLFGNEYERWLRPHDYWLYKYEQAKSARREAWLKRWKERQSSDLMM